MREVFVAAAIVIAGCASVGDQPGDDGGDGVGPDAINSNASLTDDSAADFAAAAMGETMVEPWGAVAPAAYYTGGLVVRGSDTGEFLDAATATWDQVQAFPATGTTAITWTSSVNWGTGTPPTLGLTSSNDLTAWAEGEIWLEAGTWTFSLVADDHGFVELARPATTAFTRVASANWPDPATGTFTAAVSGWYPLRFAVTEVSGGAGYTLAFQGPGVASLQPIPRDRFRARVDALAGMVEAGFDDNRCTGEVATTIDAVAPANVDWGAGSPTDLALTDSESFSTRWTGQLRIDVAGSYTFRYSTDDCQRLWIDGVKRLDTFPTCSGTALNVTGAIDLAAGWHDLVIEQSDFGGNARALLTVDSGPELAGRALPVDRLRPAEGRADRVAPGVNHTDVTIPTKGTATSSVAVTAPAGALVTGVDVSLTATHTYRTDLRAYLRAPDGTEVLLRDYSLETNLNGQWSDAFTTTGVNGIAAAGTWTVVVYDVQDQDGGTILDAAITPHYAGGAPPIPETSWFESTVHDLGDGVRSIDAVTWTERAAPGASIAVRVRTCALPPGCLSAPWSDPVTTSGGTPSVGPGRYLQYRIELTTDGDHAPAVDSIRVDYSTATTGPG